MTGWKAAACVGFLLAGPAWASSVEPVAALRLLGGQYFFSGQKAGLSGNASALVAPAVRLGERLRLLPVFSSRYQGTKQALDLTGSGTLFQEQMEHRASLRAEISRPLSRWRFKPSLSYKYQLLKETKDEAWTRGLFDHWKVGAGLEAEYSAPEPFSVRFALEDFITAFPNYVSLESQAGADLEGRPLGRELAGRRVLNSHSQAALLAASTSLGQGSLEGRLRVQRSRFPGQRLVDERGDLGAATREDYHTGLTFLWRRPVHVAPGARLIATLDLGAANNASNQNSYDARRFRFLRRYYNYQDLRLGAGGELLFGDVTQPAAWSLSGSWALRAHLYRPPQNEAGEYGAGRVAQRLWALFLGLRLPVARRVHLVFDVEVARASSNQGYERATAYNYSVANYLFGVAYDY